MSTANHKPVVKAARRKAGASAAAALPLKPTPDQRAGLSAIRSEIDALIDDLLTYHNEDEKRRARELAAGLEFINAAVARATEGGVQ